MNYAYPLIQWFGIIVLSFVRQKHIFWNVNLSIQKYRLCSSSFMTGINSLYIYIYIYTYIYIYIYIYHILHVKHYISIGLPSLICSTIYYMSSIDSIYILFVVVLKFYFLYSSNVMIKYPGYQPL